MNDYDIVAYSYRADEYCPACIIEKVNELANFGSLDWALFDTESWLVGAANILGINREDESSYDSDDFPKPCMRYQMEDYEDGTNRVCAECHGEIS